MRLEKFDPGFHGKHEDEPAAVKELAAVELQLGELQRKMYGDNRHSLLIVLQGMDAAGKDGVCWHVIAALTRKAPASPPSRCRRRKPRTTSSGAFIRTPRPRRGRGIQPLALRGRAGHSGPRAGAEDGLGTSLRAINDWERLLHEENGTTILKFCLVVSTEEQLKRFKARLEDPSGSGRSATPTTRSAPTSTIIWPPSTKRSSGPRPRTRRGSRSPATTNGSETWRWPRSSWMRSRR